MDYTLNIAHNGMRNRGQDIFGKGVGEGVKVGIKENKRRGEIKKLGIAGYLSNTG